MQSLEEIYYRKAVSNGNEALKKKYDLREAGNLWADNVRYAYLNPLPPEQIASGISPNVIVFTLDFIHDHLELAQQILLETYGTLKYTIPLMRELDLKEVKNEHRDTDNTSKVPTS